MCPNGFIIAFSHRPYCPTQFQTLSYIQRKKGAAALMFTASSAALTDETVDIQQRKSERLLP